MDERDPNEPQDEHVEEHLDVEEPVPGDEFDTDDDPAPRRTLPRYTIHEIETHQDPLGRKFCFTPDGRAICGRRRKKKNAVIEDEACMAGPTTSGPCRVHGAGAGPPMTAGGRYSRVLRGWRAMYEEALHDQDLLDTRSDLAMMDAALVPLVKRVEEGDSPRWRAQLREAFEQLDLAVKRKQHNRVGPLMREVGRLIEEGATADEVAEDLVRHVDRRAARAHKINELEVRRDQTVSLAELTVVFAGWIEALRETLDDAAFRKVLPRLQALANAPRPGIVGSLREREARERAKGSVEGVVGQKQGG